MIAELLRHAAHAVGRWLVEDPAAQARRGACALVVGLVVYNAAFAQQGAHGAPWFGPERPVETAANGPDARAIAPAPDPIVFGLQSELMDLGLYDGAIDGLWGRRTRAAIVAYERAQGLPETGEPTGALLGRIRIASVRDLPRPQRPPDDPLATGSVGDADGRGGAGPDASPDPEAGRRAMVAAIQRGLRTRGFAIEADGLMGPRTRAAIEGYQAERGLSVTGLADEALLDDMEAAGLVR